MQSRKDIYKSIYNSKDISLLDYLNNSSYDALFEINLNKNEVKQLYHQADKYMIFDTTLTFEELYEYVLNHLVYNDDRKIFEDFFSPRNLLKRLREKDIPGFDYADFRYRMQNEGYRYVEQCMITGKDHGVPNGVIRLYVFDIDNFYIHQLGMGKKSTTALLPKNNLSGLYDSKEFLEEAESLLEKQRKRGWSVLSIDIEHFKFFNEWYGKDKGEELLANIAKVVSKWADKDHGLGGYFGKDDFVLMTPYAKEDVVELYRELRNAIIATGASFGFLPAIGVALVEEGMMAIDALNRASIAVNNAKKEPNEHIYTYSVKERYQIENEYKIISEFMNALKNDEVTFFLQPQVRIVNKNIIGAEALARWIKADGTVVPPMSFIPVLEKYGFITDLDKYIWEKVVKYQRDRLDKKENVVPISLNISRIDVNAIDVAQHFHDLIRKYDVPTSLIKLEITESAYIDDSEAVTDLLPKLRKEGFLVMMDDFGSGYSSLNMLSHVRVDAIKLDAGFLKLNTRQYEKTIHIIETVVNMTKQIAVPLIVEGVETKEQIEFLDGLGCEYVQGYYYYKPLTIKDFEALISDDKIIDELGFVVKLNEEFRIREFLDKNIYSDSMLNHILGPVAIYSLHGDHIDITRFNQQFYEAVNVPDFHEKLVNIEQLLPEEDRNDILRSIKAAKANKLTGSISGVLRFARIDGGVSPFTIHFYYIGKKEGRDTFYGSARNVTRLVDLEEERKLITYYGNDSFIFVRKIYSVWNYRVVSHGLSDILGFTPEELEESMNDGTFKKRIVDQEELSQFMFDVTRYTDNKEDFEKVFIIRDVNDIPQKILLKFTYVGDKSYSIKYILRSELVK